jgi:hypothetical protein
VVNSPTQRSLKHLRDLGYTVAVAEYWNPHARRRIDLFGVFDLVAIGDGGIIGVQTTTAANISARRAKIAESREAAKWLRAGGRILLHGWRKKKLKRGGVAFRWIVNEEEIT